MKSFAIITDSSCDLNKELRDRFQIDEWVVSDIIFPDGHSERADLDWGNISPEEYFGSMVDKKLRYKSSAPGPERIKDSFRKQLDAGRDVLCITLSSGMSAMYDLSCIAAKELAEEYPQRTIRVINSKRYSTAIGLLCVYASQMRSEGKTITETAGWLEEHLDRFHQSGWMDDLFFLARSGRLSKGTAIMGTMVGVKPMADFNMESGMFQVIGKARGVSRAFKAVVSYIQKTIEKPEDQIMFLAHSLRADYAWRLSEMIQKEIHPKELILNTVGQTCGANIGPGLVAAFYYGKPLSQGLTEETEILKEIL